MCLKLMLYSVLSPLEGNCFLQSVGHLGLHGQQLHGRWRYTDEKQNFWLRDWTIEGILRRSRSNQTIYMIQ